MNNDPSQDAISNLARRWLDCFVTTIPGVVQTQFYWGEGVDQGCPLLCSWPNNVEIDNKIEQMAQQAIKKKKALTYSKAMELNRSSQSGAQVRLLNVAQLQSFFIAVPIIINHQSYGALSVHIRTKAKESPERFLPSLIQAVKWLSLVNIANNKKKDVSNDVASIVLKATQVSLSRSSLNEAATALSIELAALLHCDMVAMGFIEEKGSSNHNIKIEGISTSPNFSKKQHLVKDVSALMEEAIDQDRIINEPAENQADRSALIHRKYSRQHGNARLCSAPLVHDNHITGAMVFERSRNGADFSSEEVLLIQQITALVSPIFVYRERSQQSLFEHGGSAIKEFIGKVVGTGSLTWKMSSVLCVLVVLFFTFATGTHRISTNATLEGRIQRFVSAPEDGYIQNVEVRPGDKVEVNQLLATLDDRELLLEKQKWTSKLQQTANEYREALAGQESWRIGLLRAQRKQVEAQLDLVNTKLERLRIVSPLTGIVVSGDFTQSLGSPIQQGEKLFTIAPLDDYRVYLKADESDISFLSAGQTGLLTLRAAVGEPLAFQVEKVIPLAVSENEINYFRVDALLEKQPDYLRPGMQGVAKIEVGEQRLIWIWSRRLIEWLQLKIWTWW